MEQKCHLDSKKWMQKEKTKELKKQKELLG